MELIIRFDYGHIIPWVRKKHDGLEAIAGPDALILRTPIETRGEDLTTVAEFNVAQGDRVPFVLTWFASHEEPPRAIHPEHALQQTEEYWMQWSKHCRDQGPWRDAVVRSLITLKGLTYAPTGGIVAAATTSLPEEIGGVRNWDYRYCWLRDATFTLYALMNAGYLDEARAWREWLLRAIAGSAAQMQIMYGVHGERRLDEFEIAWLSGYENSKPVRIGNAASNQFQLDVYGEVMAAMYVAHRAGIETSEADWKLQVALMNFLESKWEEPDDGIWEVRGGTTAIHAFQDDGVAGVRSRGEADRCLWLRRGEHLERWRKIRDEIHQQVCEQGYNAKKKAFTQFYGSDQLDASLLMMPLTGFLPPSDERVVSTVEAIQRELMEDGLILRYRLTEGFAARASAPLSTIIGRLRWSRRPHTVVSVTPDGTIRWTVPIRVEGGSRLGHGVIQGAPPHPVGTKARIIFVIRYTVPVPYPEVGGVGPLLRCVLAIVDERGRFLLFNPYEEEKLFVDAHGGGGLLAAARCSTRPSDPPGARLPAGAEPCSDTPVVFGSFPAIERWTIVAPGNAGLYAIRWNDEKARSRCSPRSSGKRPTRGYPAPSPHRVPRFRTACFCDGGRTRDVPRDRRVLGVPATRGGDRRAVGQAMVTGGLRQMYLW